MASQLFPPFCLGPGHTHVGAEPSARCPLLRPEGSALCQLPHCAFHSRIPTPTAGVGFIFQDCLCEAVEGKLQDSFKGPSWQWSRQTWAGKFLQDLVLSNWPQGG